MALRTLQSRSQLSNRLSARKFASPSRIAERKAFDKAWLAIQTPVSGNVTLMRALAGGALELHGGSVALSSERKTNGRHLSARHDHTNGENVSQFLLAELGFGSRFIAVVTAERSVFKLSIWINTR